MSKQGNMNISRVTNEQMQTISEILPQLKQPIKPRNTQGYGFEQVLRKEQEKLEYTRESEFYEDFHFNSSELNTEVEVDNFVDDIVNDLCQLGTFVYLGYHKEENELIVKMLEKAVVTIKENGKYQPADESYDLRGPSVKLDHLTNVIIRGWN